MKILSWNVLHRVHAENYGEPSIVRWADETARVTGIIDLLRETRCDVALLQEVSGDVLAALRAAFPHVLSHEYPRVPRQKRPAKTIDDTKEHLVVLAPTGSKVSRAQTFPNDPGKGLLRVEVSPGLFVISTHVSWGPKAAPQWPLLAQALTDVDGVVCLGGDFNTGGDEVSRALGPEVQRGLVGEGALTTRAGGENIDFLFVRGASLSEVQVLPHGDLSDHRPIVTSLELVGARSTT